MNKRDFLKLSTLMILSGQLSNTVFAKSNADINLITILLRGGADGLDILVPYADNYYYEQRQNISIKKQDCFQINSDFGINNKMPFLHNLYKNNNLYLIPAAGQTHNSRSHFLAQDVLEYGVNNVINYDSGFLSRLIEKTSFKGVSFTENITPIMKNKNLIIPTMPKGIMSGLFNYKGTPSIKDPEINKVYVEVEKNMKISNEIKGQLNNNYTDNKLMNAFKAMKLGNYNLSFVDFDDWDTHANQRSRMNKLLNNLDNEIKNLKNSMSEQEWKKTAIVITTEFGRVVKENGFGTDHGHGSLLILTGGVINKSKILGDWIVLKDSQLHENRDLPVLHETRNILAELFVEIFNLNNAEINYIFPNAVKTNFNLI